MNNMPPNIDNLLSLLGEADMIKNALTSFDKSINMALASNEVSQFLGPEGHFHTLKKMEMVHASLLSLNVELITIAEHLTNSATNQSPQAEPSDPIPMAKEKEENNPQQNNPLVNNVLDYLNERMDEDDNND